MSLQPVVAVAGSDRFEISSDRARIDRAFVHNFLGHDSYWSRNIPFDVVDRSIENSLCFGAFHRGDDTQIGFARVITDSATFAFVRDVFVIEEFRGLGVGRMLTEAMLAHASLQGLRRIMLATRDADGFYEKFGFRALARPNLFFAIEHSAKELYSL